jgi:hypothetical protein
MSARHHRSTRIAHPRQYDSPLHTIRAPEKSTTLSQMHHGGDHRFTWGRKVKTHSRNGLQFALLLTTFNSDDETKFSRDACMNTNTIPYYKMLVQSLYIKYGHSIGVVWIELNMRNWICPLASALLGHASLIDDLYFSYI